MYLEKMKAIIQRDTCTPIFIAALFTIAKTWRQPKPPSKDEWIKKTWYKIRQVGGDTLGTWNVNAIKLGYDDHCTTVSVIKFIEKK